MIKITIQIGREKGEPKSYKALMFIQRVEGTVLRYLTLKKKHSWTRKPSTDDFIIEGYSKYPDAYSVSAISDEMFCRAKSILHTFNEPSLTNAIKYLLIHESN